MRPELDAECEHAMRWWNLLGGWFPERLPVLAAVYPIPDPDALMERLYSIRVAIDAIGERERKARR